MLEIQVDGAESEEERERETQIYIKITTYIGLHNHSVLNVGNLSDPY